MIIAIGCLVIVGVTIIAIIRSKKPVKLILAEAKYEILYQIIGSQYLMQDFLMRKKNKTDLHPQSGKVAVITGGTRGIGLEVIKLLLKCDITVIIGCRNVALGETLLKKFRDEDILTGNIEVYQLDISVIDSIRNFASTLKQKYSKIHYLINNAGIMFGPFMETRDGYESQFSTNYLGHFLLAHLLLPELKAAGEEKRFSRIVNVSSCAHIVGDIKFEDINCRNNYIPSASYAQSKLAQILFTCHLDKVLREEKAKVQVHSVHPGIVNTDLFNDSYLKKISPWVPSLLFKTPEQGAFPIIHACLSPSLEGKGGTYIHNCEVVDVCEKAKSADLQEEMFNFTMKLLNIEKFGTPV